MRTRRLIFPARSAFLLAASVYLISCQGVSDMPTIPVLPPSNPNFSGVLMWKGDPSSTGLNSNETTLTPANVSVSQFGQWGAFQGDGIMMAQPLYVSQLDMGAAGTHNVILVTTENDSVYAIDADNPTGPSLWERHYVNPATGVTVMPDSFGGQPVLGGKVGITGTPYIDISTKVIYFVTTLAQNGVPQQWLRALDIRTGNDFGPGSVMIQASVPGDGKGSVNGQIPFDPSLENQRAGLTKANGAIIVPWGSFSDWGVYHGWLMAFDPATLNLMAVFNPTPQAQSVDAANGPSDHGGGGSFWQGGAAPAIDSNGNIYLNAANGSFNANTGGSNYGDTMLKLTLSGNSFQVVDSFTPSSEACLDFEDLELGSGGVALLPTDFTNGTKLAVGTSKEGRLFVVNTSTMGGFNAGSDLIPQEFMVGESTCSDTADKEGDVTEGPDWNRLYGTPSYWNGNLYVAPSNMGLKQYQFQGGLLNPTPTATSPGLYGLRGANTVVSANGTQNGIIWAYEKSASGQGILHAYDATNVAKELWNSNMNSLRDALGQGIGFATPVVADGRVIVTYDTSVGVFGSLQ